MVHKICTMKDLTPVFDLSRHFHTKIFVNRRIQAYLPQIN
jgi:hypothetical protein